MQKFIVIVTNEILGNSRHEMTLDEIKRFNLCAYRLAVKSAKNYGQEYSDGMWTVRAANAELCGVRSTSERAPG